MIFNCNGLKIETRDHLHFDRRILDEVTVENVYLQNQDELPTGHPVTVIDAGAHIGCFSLMVAGQAIRRGLDFKIIAVEPVPENYEQLVKNIQMNGLEEKIIAVQKAITAKTGTGKIVRGAVNTGAGTMIGNMRDAIEVETITLPELMQTYSIAEADILKMDIEGMEFENVLSWPENFTFKFGRIVMEWHGGTVKLLGVEVYEKMLAILRLTHKVGTIGLPTGGGNLYATKLL